jgi:hypothetical protein
MEAGKRRGVYKVQSCTTPSRLADITLLAPKSAPIYMQQIAPTGPAADKFYEDQTSAQIAGMDANDTLYAFESSRDYNPEPDLEKITASMIAINSADDYIIQPAGASSTAISNASRTAASSCCPPQTKHAATIPTYSPTSGKTI